MVKDKEIENFLERYSGELIPLGINASTPGPDRLKTKTVRIFSRQDIDWALENGVSRIDCSDTDEVLIIDEYNIDKETRKWIKDEVLPYILRNLNHFPKKDEE